MARRSSLLVQVVNASIRAAKEAERDRVRAQKAQVRYQAQLSREARRAWAEDMASEAEDLTVELQEKLTEIDEILRHTLEVDDFFDLERLRQHVDHPQMQSKNGVPFPEPKYETFPEKPRGASGLIRMFAKAKADEIDAERALKWEAKCIEVEDANRKSRLEWEKSEESRQVLFEEDKKRYAEECLAREIDVQKANAELDAVIKGLPLGEKNSVETYVELVLSESEYPENFEPKCDVEFDSISRELSLGIELAEPSEIPTVASYRFQKNIGEIVEKAQTQKSIRERYERYVCSTVLRTIHEILEADRDGVVRMVAATAHVSHISKATGNPTKSKLVEIAVDRQRFIDINLASVEPRAALESLGASLSKDFAGLAKLLDGMSVKRK